MIGAVGLQRGWGKSVEEAFARRSVDELLSAWAEDGVLEFGGTHGMSGRFVGRKEIRAWFERWLAGATAIRFHVGRVAVTRPWALGLTNTLMYEWTVDETSRSGVTVHAEGVGVTELRKGQLVHERIYLFDETPELRMWGPKAAAVAAS